MNLEITSSKRKKMNTQNVGALASHDLNTIRWDQTVEEAALLMEKNRYGHLAVTDSSGKVVGAIAKQGIHRAKLRERPGFLADSRVFEFMNYPALTVPSGTSVETAAANMLAENATALLVTDESGKISGIITSEDLIAALLKTVARPGPLEKLERSPLLHELLREAQSAGL
jgi:CBS domain-containing protein